MKLFSCSSHKENPHFHGNYSWVLVAESLVVFLILGFKTKMLCFLHRKMKQGSSILQQGVIPSSCLLAQCCTDILHLLGLAGEKLSRISGVEHN